MLLFLKNNFAILSVSQIARIWKAPTVDDISCTKICLNILYFHDFYLFYKFALNFAVQNKITGTEDLL